MLCGVWFWQQFGPTGVVLGTIRKRRGGPGGKGMAFGLGIYWSKYGIDYIINDTSKKKASIVT